MAELERTRGREREAPRLDSYERAMEFMIRLRERAFKGRIVIREEEQPWELSRQGRLKFFLCREADTGSALNDWEVFIHDVHTHSGKHRHQGGLVIYIIEGEGWTEMDGQRVEWEAGDLLLMPIKQGGVEHKHFNKHPGQGCRWMAFIYSPYGDAIGSYMEQQEVHPEYR